MTRNFHSLVQTLVGLPEPQRDQPRHLAHGACHAPPALQDGPEIGKNIMMEGGTGLYSICKYILPLKFQKWEMMKF